MQWHHHQHHHRHHHHHHHHHHHSDPSFATVQVYFVTIALLYLHEVPISFPFCLYKASSFPSLSLMAWQISSMSSDSWFIVCDLCSKCWKTHFYIQERSNKYRWNRKHKISREKSECKSTTTAMCMYWSKISVYNIHKAVHTGGNDER